MGNFPKREDATSVQNERPSMKDEPTRGRNSLGHASRRPRQRGPGFSHSKGEAPSIRLSESMDEEIEAEFSQLGFGEEGQGEGLEALDPDLELQGPDDSNKTRVAILGRLSIFEGPDAKREVSFVGVRMVLGRAPDLEISLTDVAVSRRHAEFVRGDGGVLLRDLGSGNGTLVNGERVTEQILAHNDVITVGETKLRYMNEAEARSKPEPTSIQRSPQLSLTEKRRPAELDVSEQVPGQEQEKPSLAPSKPGRRVRRSGGGEGANKKKRLILIASGAGVLLCLLVAVLLGGKAKEPPKGPEETQEVITAERYMEQVRDAVRQGLYEEALGFLAQAKAVDPNADVSNLGPQIELERDVQKRLQEVVALLERREFTLAKEGLAKTPEASVRLNEEKKKLSERLIHEERQFHLQRSEELLMYGDFDAAVKAMALLPRIQQVAVGEKIEVAKASYEEARRQARKNVERSEADTSRRKKEARREEVSAAFVEVRRRFEGEDWKRAVDECDRLIERYRGDGEIRKRAQELRRKIPEFGQAYDEGVRKYRAGQIGAAAKPLTKAYGLYRSIALSSATMDSSLKEMLSQAALLAGEDAFARGDYAKAADYFKEARKLQPSSERAKRGLERVVAKAEDLFGMGYSLKSTSPREAQRYFELIVQITPSNSLWHEKAKNQLASMAPARRNQD